MTEIKKQFSGQRLRIARTFRGNTQADVGDALKISKQFVGELERGTKLPSETMTLALGDLLGFEPEFFNGPTLDEFIDTECNFRRRRVTPISIRIQALAYGTLLNQFWSYANEILNLPRQCVPTLNITGRPDLERAADRCRMEWGLGLDTPIDNMVTVIESKGGVPVARFGEVGEKVDAFSRAGNLSVVVLTNKPASGCRHDLAHECAHLVLHRDKPTGTPEIEREAEQFARALLLPRNGFRKEFPRLDSAFWEMLFQLKLRWKASLSDMILRARDLRLINGVQYLRLYKELSRQGWLRIEPYEFHRESPNFLLAVFERLKTLHQLDHAAIGRALGWSIQTLVEITSVPMEAKPKPTVRMLTAVGRG